MKRSGVLSALVLALGLAPPCFAQNQPAPASPSATAPAAPAAATRYSVDTKFSVLFADPKAAEVVKAYFRKRRAAKGKPEPTPEERERLEGMIGDMSPREVAQFPQADLDDAALAELDALLAQVPFPSVTPAGGPTQP